jgi:tRNA (adenine-N(1)-)-methyltransferase non-catalytic subunit
LITICDVDSPPAYPVMECMNFRADIVSVLSSLNWATAKEDYKPGRIFLTSSCCFSYSAIVMASSDVPQDQIKSEKHRTRLNKRKMVSDQLTNIREELFAGEFDGYGGLATSVNQH